MIGMTCWWERGGFCCLKRDPKTLQNEMGFAFEGDQQKLSSARIACTTGWEFPRWW